VNIIETKALTKVFSLGRGLFGVDLAVAEGAIFGFLGPNGSGKTTTVRLLLDYLRPDSGEARVFGLDCRCDSVAIRARIGYVPGEVRLPEHLTGREFLEYHCDLRRVAFPEKRLGELKEALDVTTHLRIKSLSKGNKQKLALIQAFLHDPALVLLDEPTEGLDPLVQQGFYAMLEAYRARGGTVFMSSHVLSEVERVCDSVAIIRGGKVVTVERVEDLIRRKVRHLELVFAEDIDKDQFMTRVPGLTLREWEGRRASFSVAGAVDPVVKSLAGFQLADLSFAPVSLEEAFLDFYRGDPGGERK
jgi:ABC-2 type transport system ATP-binding protein